MRGIFALLGLLILTVPASGALPAEQPYRIGESGRLVTNVTIDGQGPFSFLIDTASSISLIYEHVRKQLNLGPSQPGHLLVYGINDVTEALPVKPRAIGVAGEEVKDLTIGVLPNAGADEADGVLGLDVLARYFVVLDRNAMRLRLLAPEPASAKPYEDWAQAKLTARPLRKFPIRFWYLNARFNQRRFTTLFDLGAGTTMMNWDAAEQLGVHKRDFDRFGPPPEDLQDVLGKSSPAVRVMNLDVGLPGKTWERQFAIVSNAPVFGYFDLDERPAAIMGPGLLRDTSLAIDFVDGRLYLGPTK
ncbi:MAG TPA: aspartyl protease family protein [Rhizomicrobium sp.]|nr:aspartyl protease family protein [Rhizomicrobium sp.]